MYQETGCLDQGMQGTHNPRSSIMSHTTAFQPRRQRSPAPYPLNDTSNPSSLSMVLSSNMRTVQRGPKGGHFQNHAGAPLLTSELGNTIVPFPAMEDSPPEDWILPPEYIERRLYNGEEPWSSVRANYDTITTSSTPYGPLYPTHMPPDCDQATFMSDSGYGTKASDTQSALGESDRNHESQNFPDPFNNYQDTYPREAEPQQSWSKPTLARTQSAEKGEGSLICPRCKKQVKTKSEMNKHDKRHTKPYVCKVPNCTRAGRGFSTTNDLDRHKKSVHPGIFRGSCYVCPLDQCQKKVKYWPRADNFRSHLHRIHQLEITADSDISIYLKEEGPTESSQSQAAEEPVADGEYLPLDANPGIPSMSDTSMWTPADQKSLELGPSRTTPPQSDCRMDLAHVSGHIPDTVVGTFGDPQSHDQTLGQDLMELDPVPPTTIELDHTSSALEDGETPRGDQQYDQTDNVLDQPSLVSPKALRDEPGQAVAATEIAINEPNQTEEKVVSDCRSLGDVSAQSSSKQHSDGDTDTRSQGSPECSDASSPRPRPEPKVDDGQAKMSDASSSDVLSSRLGVNDCDPKEDEKAALALLQRLQDQGILEKLIKKVGVHEKKGPLPESYSLNHPCPDCPKGFGRRCELRKHMKRHQKPYFCTNPGCLKKFGSKNDWKRHENSQHFQLEVWKCDCNGTDGNPCGKVCHRRETFKSHISKEHNIKNDRAEAKLEVCRIGRAGEARFWCGFCQEVVDLKHSGGEPWTKRFDHIDAHICGKDGFPRQSMIEWKSVDPYAIPGANNSIGSDQPTDSQGQGQNAESSRGKGMKRGLEEGSPEPSANKAKRTSVRRDANTLWSCCQCHKSFSNIKTTEICLFEGCDHRRCRNCATEIVDVKD